MRHLAGGLVLMGFMTGALPVGSAWGQDPGTPTADEIVVRMAARNAERQAALARYSSDRTYRVEYKGTGGEHHGEMLVHAEYSAPGQKRLTVVSESGSKVMCERVLRKVVASEEEASAKTNRTQMALLPENYHIELLGEETVDGVRAWVLRVSPKVENKFTYRGRVWVSMDDYAMVRLVGEPAKNPSWWISRASFDWRYGRNGEFWLPVRNVAVSHVRIGGEATLTIDYGEYQVVAASADRTNTSENVRSAQTAGMR
jgi:hypothetical protein